MTNDEKEVLLKTRATPQQVDDAIINEAYHIFPGTKLTICCLYLRNGFVVTGEFDCVHQEDFDEQFGRKMAKENAKQKVWALEGYALRELTHICRCYF